MTASHSLPARRPELGKWLLWKLFHQSAALRPYLPMTAKLSPATFHEFTARYPSVYLKPVAGARGRGVIRLWRTPQAARPILIQLENRPVHRCSSWEEAYQQYLAVSHGRPYIIQRDVGLLTSHGRAFDIRVMMQRDASGQWQCTAVVAKIAGPHSAVTNIARSRGRVVPLAHALQSAGPHRTAAHLAIEGQLRELGRLTVQQLETYQRYAEIGVDAGIDRHMRIWLLEANTGPSHRLFQHMEDPSVYELVQKTANARRRQAGARGVKFRAASR